MGPRPLLSTFFGSPLLQIHHLLGPSGQPFDIEMIMSPTFQMKKWGLSG